MTETAVAEIMTKSDFAAHVARHPAFVTRAIEQGKLTGAALVGEGRGTRIRVTEAMRQLSIKLDLSQQLARPNPITGLPPAPAVASPAAASAPAGDDDISKERMEQMRLRNAKFRMDLERGAREDAVAAGELVDAGAVSRALSRQIAPLINTFDELPAAIAKPIAEEFGLSYPQVLIVVRKAVRRTQTAWSERAAAVGRVGAAQVAG